MDIAIFKAVTTDEVIHKLEQDGIKYDGLYVDMEDSEARKYVKEQASTINNLIKQVDRKRIDESKEYKAKVEKEAKSIITRLQKANEPYTLLIDQHKEERAKVLTEKKRKEELKELAIKKEDDHEVALLINKTYEYDKEQELKAKQEYEQQIKDSAIAHALDVKKREDEQQEQDRINSENARLANIEHVRSVNKNILNVLVSNGITEADAKTIISLAARKQLPQLTINY